MSAPNQISFVLRKEMKSRLLFVVQLAASVSLIPTNWREPAFFNCLLKAGRAVSQNGSITEDCRVTLAAGFVDTKVASSAEMELMGMGSQEVVTMNELITKVKPEQEEVTSEGSGQSDKEYIMIPVEIIDQYRSSKPKTVDWASLKEDVDSLKAKLDSVTQA